MNVSLMFVFSGNFQFKTGLLTTTIFIHFKKLVSNFVKIATMLQN